MKTALTLPELATKLQAMRDAKNDYIVDTRALQVEAVGEGRQLVVNVHDSQDFVIRQHALRQMQERVKIPASYGNYLQDAHPDLLAHNLTELFRRKPEKRLMRTINNNCRAFLSDGYRIMDNFDLAEAVLPVILDAGAEVISCDVTERKMYVKAILPDMVKEFGPPPGAQMGVGHTMFVEKVVAGITVGNSEIGDGKLFVQPSAFTERCTNWCSWDDQKYARVHLGKRASGDSEAMIAEVMSDETKRKSDEALWAQVRDVATAAMDGRLFDKIVEKLQAARGDQIEGDPVVTVERVAEQLQLTEDERGSVLNHLIAGGDLSRYGLHAAIPRTSNDIDSYDRATELEQFGGRVIDLAPQDWQRLAA